MSRDTKEYKIDIADAKITPEKVFESPEDVLAAPGLSLDDKREILKAWEQNARQLLRAESEGMGGGEGTKLQAVQLALHSLEST